MTDSQAPISWKLAAFGDAANMVLFMQLHDNQSDTHSNAMDNVICLTDILRHYEYFALWILAHNPIVYYQSSLVWVQK